MQENKTILNIKKFFNPKAFFVGFVTITTILFVSSHAYIYLLTSLLGEVRVDSNCLGSLPFYLLQLFIAVPPILFFFWKKESMKKIQKAVYWFMIISYCLYCTLVFLDLETGGIMALRDYFEMAVPMAMFLFLVYFITQVASVFIENKIFWYFAISLGIVFFIFDGTIWNILVGT